MFSSFFGSKKTKNEPKEPESKAPATAEGNDDFTFLPPMPSYFNHVGADPKAAAPSATTVAAATPIGSDNQLNKFSELEGIPFQLSPQCEMLLKNSKAARSDSVPFLRKPDLSQFNYDFSKERSVLRE